jgi:hypothetical protein
MSDMKRRYHIHLNGQRVCRTLPLPYALDALPAFAGKPRACVAKRIGPSTWVAWCTYDDALTLQIAIRPTSSQQ